MPIQKTFTLVPQAPGRDVSALRASPARPMTSKQVKKAYKASNNVPRMSRAEIIKQERAEQARIRKEFEKEKAAAKAKLLRDKKKEKEQAVQEAKRREGKPLVDVRPSQDTIARFVRGNGSGKKRNAVGDLLTPPIARQGMRTAPPHEEHSKPSEPFSTELDSILEDDFDEGMLLELDSAVIDGTTSPAKRPPERRPSPPPILGDEFYENLFDGLDDLVDNPLEPVPKPSSSKMAPPPLPPSLSRRDSSQRGGQRARLACKRDLGLLQNKSQEQKHPSDSIKPNSNCSEASPAPRHHNGVRARTNSPVASRSKPWQSFQCPKSPSVPPAPRPPPCNEPPLSTQAILFNVDDFFPSATQQALELEEEQESFGCGRTLAGEATLLLGGTTEKEPATTRDPRAANPEMQAKMNSHCSPAQNSIPEESPKPFFTSSGTNQVLALALQRSRITAATEELQARERQRLQVGASRAQKPRREVRDKPVEVARTHTVEEASLKPAVETVPLPTKAVLQTKPTKTASQPQSQDKENLAPCSQETEYGGGDWMEDAALELMI